MRRFLFFLLAAAAAGLAGWFLVTETFPKVWRVAVSPDAHPPLLWWLERSCILVLEVAVILLSITLVVRKPHERHPSVPEPGTRPPAG